MRKISSLYLFGTLLFSSGLMASDLNPIIQFGYDFGGTTLATIEKYDNYNGYEQSKIRAGQGLNLEIGAAATDDRKELELQFLIGYKFDSENAQNGSVTWDSIPFSAIGMMRKNRWKFGGGVTYHLNPTLSGTFKGYDENNNYFNDSVDDEYENALGAIVQVQYRISDNMATGVRGTFIEYKLKSDPSIVSNGDSIGLNFTYTFGERSRFK